MGHLTPIVTPARVQSLETSLAAHTRVCGKQTCIYRAINLERSIRNERGCKRRGQPSCSNRFECCVANAQVRLPLMIVINSSACKLLGSCLNWRPPRLGCKGAPLDLPQQPPVVYACMTSMTLTASRYPRGCATTAVSLCKG